MKNILFLLLAFASKCSILLCVILLANTHISAQITHFDENTGIKICVPKNHSITPNNGVFITLYSDASRGGVSLTWLFKEVTAEQLKNALRSSIQYDGFYISAVSSMETINSTQWGGYITGIVQGNKVYGYLTAIFDSNSGKGAVWLHYYGYDTSNYVAREAAIERAQMLQFSPLPTSQLPQQSGIKVDEVQKICTTCGGYGGAVCSSCNSTGYKEYTRNRTTYKGTETEKYSVACTMCSGSGKIKCYSCAGSGMKKDWEIKTNVVGQGSEPMSSAINITKAGREQAAINRFIAISKKNGWSGKAFDKYSDKFQSGYKMTLHAGSSNNTIVADYPAFPCSSNLKFVKSEETSVDNYIFTFQESLKTNKENCADGLKVCINFNMKNETAIEIKYYHPSLGLVSYGTLNRN